MAIQAIMGQCLRGKGDAVAELAPARLGAVDVNVDSPIEPLGDALDATSVERWNAECETKTMFMNRGDG
jgi:hypothetical protein